MGTYGLRVPASRVGYVPEAQGGLPPGPRVPVRTGYAYQPRAYRTYRVPWHPRSHCKLNLEREGSALELCEFYSFANYHPHPARRGAPADDDRLVG